MKVFSHFRKINTDHIYAIDQRNFKRTKRNVVISIMIIIISIILVAVLIPRIIDIYTNGNERSYDQAFTYIIFVVVSIVIFSFCSNPEVQTPIVKKDRIPLCLRSGPQTSLNVFLYS